MTPTGTPIVKQRAYDYATPRRDVDLKEAVDITAGAAVVRNVTLCLDILVYYEGTARQNADGIVTFYEEGMKLVGPTAKYALIDGKGRPKRVTARTFDLVPFWMSEQAAPRNEYGLLLESGDHPEDMSDCAFQFYHGRLAPGFVRLVLPLELLDRGIERFVDLARSAARHLRILAGGAGIAVNVHPDYPTYAEEGHIFKVSRHFAGIDLGDPRSFAKFMKAGIKCVNWLTFLGSPLVDRLGGVSALATTLGERAPLYELGGGIMVRAGDAPGFGAVNRREHLPDYHHVGSVLKSVKIPESVFGRYDDIGGSKNLKAWCARFDEALP